MTRTTGSSHGTMDVVVVSPSGSEQVASQQATSEQQTALSMVNYAGPARVAPLIEDFVIHFPMEVKLAVNSVNISQHRNSKPDAETWITDKVMRVLLPAFENIVDGLAEVERIGYQQSIKKGASYSITEEEYVARETKANQEQLAVVTKLAKQVAKA